MRLKLYSYILLALFMAVGFSTMSFAQVDTTGTPDRASTQLIYYYDEADGENYLTVTNTNDSSGVTIHVQIFRNYDPDDPGAPVLCDERDFFDFLTPNDTHVYDLDEDNFPKNEGETAGSIGEQTTLDLDTPSDTKGFAIITPVVSEADASAISFQHMIGTSRSTQPFILNAMGRDAVDLATGAILDDGTVLDGVANGFILVQPNENLVDFGIDAGDVDVVGFAFTDAYGPAGLLGYNITPGAVTWTPFIFDFLENPTSCGAVTIECFGTFGLNDDFQQFNRELNESTLDADQLLLCGGTTTPDYPDTMQPVNIDAEEFGWLRIFVSGLDDNENHISLFYEDDNAQGARWMYTR